MGLGLCNDQVHRSSGSSSKGLAAVHDDSGTRAWPVDRGRGLCAVAVVFGVKQLSKPPPVRELAQVLAPARPPCPPALRRTPPVAVLLVEDASVLDALARAEVRK